MRPTAYPAYKESGVAWLGAVPEHWQVKRLKYAASINDDALPEITDPDFEFSYVDIGSVSPVEGITQQESMIFENAPSRARRCVKAGDTIVSTVRTYLRAIAPIPLTEETLIVSTGFAVVRPRKVDSKYLSYALRESAFVESVVARSVGVSYPAVNASEIGDIAVPLPSDPEQTAIADFLDRETGRIDTLVAKKRALIGLLKEKRSALISRTITRGLPAEVSREFGLEPHTRFKDSGIEWLGEVPDGWEVAQLRRKAFILDCKHRTVPFVDDGIPLASIREVHGVEVNLSDAKQTSEEEYLNLIDGNRRPRVGDIIYSRNATVGDAALVTTVERFCMGQDVCLIRAPQHHPRFFLYLFRSHPLMSQVESLMIGSTFRRINVGQIHAFWICVPSLPEQIAIAAFLDRETAKIDRLEEKVEAAIERLREYRTALITAAVTGKIDVRRTQVKEEAA